MRTIRMDQDALATLVAKDEIRALALLYSRGVDRKDFALLRSLYAKDATADYGEFFRGSSAGFVDALERSLPHLLYTGHHICNHLTTVSGNEGEGEVYVIAYHVLVNTDGNMVERIGNSRYIDRYRREDGRWCFAHRTERNDLHTELPMPTRSGPARSPSEDPSVTELRSRLFARGARA